MDKNEIICFLTSKGIPFDVVEHQAVCTVDEADSLNLPLPEVGAKNLFLRDDKKKNFYLLTVRDRLPVRLKDFQKMIGARRLSFASEDDLMDILGLTKGSVTPFGVLNDHNCIVKVYIDSFFDGSLISVHPNDNTATVYLLCSDLVEIIQEHGNAIEYIALERLPVAPSTLEAHVYLGHPGRENNDG